MNWFVLTLMALTVYRLTRLVIKDTLPPVLWLRDHIAGGWRPLTDGEWAELRSSDKTVQGPWPLRTTDGDTKRYTYRWSWSPEWLAELWSCPWCVSGWIAGGVTAVTDIVIGIPVPVLQGVAVWALGAVAASRKEL